MSRITRGGGGRLEATTVKMLQLSRRVSNIAESVRYKNLNVKSVEVTCENKAIKGILSFTTC